MLSMKVPVAHLIANAERMLRDSAAKYAKAQAKYDAGRAAAEKALRKAVAKAATDPNLAIDENTRWDGKKNYIVLQAYIHVNIDIERIQKPDLSQIESDLKMLKATSQQEVSVSSNSDLSRYL